MNKKLIYSLCAVALLATSCDYNEDNFPGFDDNPVSNVIYHEGEFTGKYPSEGYFSLTQGDEVAGKAVIEKALTEMLSSTYPYCDAGSAAKVKLKVATILPGLVDPEVAEEYTLTDADYEAWGTGSSDPGSHHNFAYYMDIDSYLIPFCTTKFAALAEGDVVKIVYNYYSNKQTTVESKFYKKGAAEWTEFINFAPDTKYTLSKEDYETMGTGSGEPGKFHNFDATMDLDFYLTAFAKIKFPYATESSTLELAYAYYDKDKKKTETKTALYQYEGGKWSAYNPEEPIITVADRITVMKYDGKAWKLTNLISGVVRMTMTNAEYVLLFDWVKTNKPAFLSTVKPDEEEYYFGVSTAFNNINNKYSTWFSYYNVDGYLNNLEDDEIQAIMDKRLANEGLAVLVLPEVVTSPDPDMSYEVTYKVYAGRGAGDYAMSFYYNAEDKKFEWDEMTPMKK